MIYYTFDQYANQLRLMVKIEERQVLFIYDAKDVDHFFFVQNDYIVEILTKMLKL
jgi:hypothetical protein